MTIEVNATHDPALRSWVQSANDPESDFPIQNLPFGLFRANGSTQGGVALGDQIIDLKQLHDSGILTGPAAKAAAAASGDTLAPLLDCEPAAVSALRAALSQLFSTVNEANRSRLEPMLVPMGSAEVLMPLKPTAFTDFCTSYDHISRMGGGGVPKLAALALPVAYNGRASSVQADGAPVIRPSGQVELPPGSGNVQFTAEPMLDFELEFGAWLRGGNELGQAISVADAEAMIFGCCIVNDWSARGIQFFEAILGPHLGKSFLTSISPWIVTMEALAPFRVAARGRVRGEPEVPNYLLDPADRARGGINIALTADLSDAHGQSARFVRTNLAELFWTLAQMVAHQASNGAPLESGDLIATGTVSGAAENARACFAEISIRGSDKVILSGGATRTMLEDGDTLILRGRASADGFVSIGFGACSGTIYPTRGEA